MGATLATLPTLMAATATGPTATPPPTASATVATGRGLLMPSPRLRPMPPFCTAPTATASATAVSATTAAGNLPHPYVHIRGHHLRAGCPGVGEWSGIQQKSWAKI